MSKYKENIQIIRIFIRMREILQKNKEILFQLDKILDKQTDHDELSNEKVDDNVIIIIYPNPTPDFITIRFKSDIQSSVTITLIDNIGRIVYLEELENIYSGEENNINLSGLNYGLYLLRINNENFMEVEKIIKE